MVDLPLLLAELGGHGRVLCLDGVESLAEPLDLALERVVFYDVRARPRARAAAAGGAGPGARRERRHRRRYAVRAY